MIHDQRSEFRSLSIAAAFTYVGLAATAGATGWLVWTGLEAIEISSRLADARPVSLAEATAMDDRLVLLPGLVAVAFLATAIPMLIWMYRATKNQPLLGAPDPSFSARSAVLWWFVPLANYVRPFQMLREIARETATDQPWLRPIMWAWWLGWIGSDLTQRVARGVARSSDLDSAQTALWIFVAGNLVFMLSAVLGAVVVGSITAGQHRRAQRLELISAPAAGGFEPEPGWRPGLPRGGPAIAVIPLVGLVIAGLSIGLPSGSSSSGSEAGVGLEAVGRVVDRDDLVAGDCLLEPLFTTSEEQVAATRARVVDCSGDWAVFVLGTYESDYSGSFPGDNLVARESLLRCEAAATSMVYPSERTWANGARRGLCLLEAEALFTPRVGECFASTEDAVYRVDEFVPCESPHLAEVTFAGELTDSIRYPGVDVIAQEAELVCLEAFEAYVGVPFQRSTLDTTWFVPSEAQWEFLDQRYLHCLVLEPGLAPINGTLADARR